METSNDGDVRDATLASTSAVVVELDEDDIPGASLSDPLDKHTIPELKWWLLCRNIKAPSSMKKAQLVDR